METQQRHGQVEPLHPPQSLAYFQLVTFCLRNITTWAFNMTRRASNVEDFMLAGPQLLSSLGSFISPLTQLPWRLASNSVGELSLSPDAHIYPILEPQDNIFNGPKTERLSEGFGTAARGAALPTDNGARSLGSVFSYATSKWAVSCIAMAIILNRTRIFAATRRRLRLRWHTRLLLRGLPVVLLALQAIRLLQSIQCQTSSDFSQLRWADRDTTSDLAYAFPIAWFNRLSSALLFGATDRHSCQAVSMIPNLSTPGQLHGSLSLLWPSFGVMCLSQFTETLSCAVQGRPPSAETGMTLFEQSLAFAEADAAISYHFGWRSVSTIHDNFIRKAASMPASMSQARSLTLSKVNTPPEVLVVAFLSTMSHLFSHVLGIFDAQSNYRLLNTGFWGICFMATIVCNVFDFDFGNPSSQGLLRFPTVCVIGFVPHVLILAGTIVCSMIYAMSLILSAAAPPVNAELSSMTIRQRLAYARSNMQANLSLAEIRISRDMDFYTALLRTGFAAITMASEAVYLNEEQGVHTQRHTWLEELRLRELEDLRTQSAGLGSNNAQQDQVGMMGLVPVIPRTSHIACGYSRERAAQKICRGRSDSALRAGTGASERSSRWLLAVAFVWTVMRFLVRISALVALWTFSRVRLRYQPSWLLWLSRQDKCVTDGSTSQSGDDVSLRRRNSPSISYEGQIPCMEGIDVEQEFRQINQNQGEESLDSDLYKYWISGGWWGTSDGSGNYVPEVCDEGCDASSVISSSSLGIDEEGPSECHDERNFDREASHVVLADISRESSPSSDTILDVRDLARLLRPSTIEDREEAQALSAHLQSETIMTRSAYRRRENLRRSQVLFRSVTCDYGGVSPSTSEKRKCEEEEEILEEMLLSRRPHWPSSRPPTRMTSAGDLFPYTEDSSSLPCVVCRSSARTIILWPCRCLSLCDDCRVSLAMNNFDKCVCCRRDVLSFSRVFVP